MRCVLLIRIGLTSFNEHQTLTNKKTSTLAEYAQHLPLVELDTCYYGIPRKTTVANWLTEVPANFRFVVKVYQGISGQGKWSDHYESETAMIDAFLEALAPMIESGQLMCFLIQFSASFGCTKENVDYLKKLRMWFTDLPIAIELRNSSWYHEDYLKQTLQFMKNQEFSLAIVDEPQVPLNPVPFFPFVTNPEFVLFRLHGRNVAGWTVANDPNWRKKRTLYRYKTHEILELSQTIAKISEKTKEIGVIFNNNSGGDAAGNALNLIEALGLTYTDLNPRQIDLF